MSLLTVSNLSKYYGPEFIFGDVSFQIARGDKVALVGVNGAGKSTLLKIVAGSESSSGGAIHMARGTRVAYLAQEARFSGERTLMQEMHAAIAHIATLRQEMEALEAKLADSATPDWDAQMEHYGELMHRFEHAGGYEIEHRIEFTLHGLGFNPEQYDQPLAQFSGGQKTRAALAAILLSNPDLLLLDEPTNHLDLAALEWLERFLKQWEGTLVIISHDRYFLDKVTMRTLDMAFGRLEDYPAPYNRFLQLKAERLEQQLKFFQSQQVFIAKTEEFIRRFKAGQRSKEARGREKRLLRMKEGWTGGSGKTQQLAARPEDQRKIAMNLGTNVRSGEVALKLDKLVIGYTKSQEPGVGSQEESERDARSTVLIRCPEMEIGRGQRVALIGPNGSGKTTLLRTIVGEVPALAGQARLGHKIIVNYYAQSHEGLRMNVTVLEEIRRIMPTIDETRARTLLGRFLFSGDDVFKRVGDLSGGERSRVALAQLTLMNGNLLVLDEPTNHLDIDAREALETVLNEYNGTLLFVSHDRYFIDAVADTIWAVDDETITAFDGTYSEYTAATTDDRRPTTNNGTSTTDDRRPATTNGTSTNGHRPAAARNEAAPAQPLSKDQQREERKRQRKQSSLETEIAQLEADLKRLEAEMNAAGLKSDIKRVTSLGMQHAEIQEMLNTRYDEWAALS